MKDKGFFLIVDVMIALIMISLLLNLTYDSHTYKEYERIIITQQINDLLLTSQQQSLTLKEITENAKLLLPHRRIKIKHNQKITEINKNLRFTEKISNSIRYINSSNKEIYIEVIVFY